MCVHPHTHRAKELHWSSLPLLPREQNFIQSCPCASSRKDDGDGNVYIPGHNSQASKGQETQPQPVLVASVRAGSWLPIPPTFSSSSPFSRGNQSLGSSKDQHPPFNSSQAFHFQRDGETSHLAGFSPSAPGAGSVLRAIRLESSTAPLPTFCVWSGSENLIEGGCCDYLMASQTAMAWRIKFHICFHGVNLSSHTPPVMMCTREIMFKLTKAK